ncbi:hypothetical protein QO010_004259 [Caulobacter ginsengisoli]|uniref:NIPSNAP domain-containing protein n=1 Tax=Caulobacter ginsengisoli TaxID=400775 RepID=A0ABU0IWR5_9CAUL|nr:NIPSNAP family protein [Caulobacter ginsengisoli]MDQ0466466.1 hypothetical protein [Caulobacter ginsengisoli]
MIVEIRTYRIKPGFRQPFLDLFTARTGPLLRSLGMGVVGPFVDLEDENVFVWLRSFPSLEARQRLKAAFDTHPVWSGELEPQLLPLLEDYQVILTSPPPGFIDALTPLSIDS